MKVLMILAVLCTIAPAHADPSESFWLFAMEGKFEQVPQAKACGSTAKLAIINYIGSTTFAFVDDGAVLMLQRGRTIEKPVKHYIGDDGEWISIWYHRQRTMIVTLFPPQHDGWQYITVTLLIEGNREKRDQLKCFERWIGKGWSTK